MQRTIVITGASDGVGAAAARTLTSTGARVVVVGCSGSGKTLSALMLAYGLIEGATEADWSDVVVADTENSTPGSCLSSRQTDVLPAPEGPEITTSLPGPLLALIRDSLPVPSTGRSPP